MDTRSHFVVLNSAWAILKQRDVDEKCWSPSFGFISFKSIDVACRETRVSAAVVVLPLILYETYIY